LDMFLLPFFTFLAQCRYTTFLLFLYFILEI
jgi:hypothetical protein